MPGPMSCPSGEGRSQGEGAANSHWASIILSVAVSLRRSLAGSAFFWGVGGALAAVDPRPRDRLDASQLAQTRIARCRDAASRGACTSTPRTACTIRSSPTSGTGRPSGCATTRTITGTTTSSSSPSTGEIDPDTGYVLDLNMLKDLAQERLLSHLDHRNLNLDVPWFRDLIPTSENIAVVCWRELRAVLPASSPSGCGSGRPRGTMSTTKARDGAPRVTHPESADRSLEPFAEKVREILRRPRRGSRPGRPAQDPGAGRSRRSAASPRATGCRWPTRSATRCSRSATRA